MNFRDGWVTRLRAPRVVSRTLESFANRRLGWYILRNSGSRVWAADRLVTVAGHLNPAKPWKRTAATTRGQHQRTQPWWKGRCREIADQVNLAIGSSGIAEVSSAQVELVLLRAERVRNTGVCSCGSSWRDCPWTRGDTAATCCLRCIHVPNGGSR